jgi:hypothetical protein
VHLKQELLALYLIALVAFFVDENDRQEQEQV